MSHAKQRSKNKTGNTLLQRWAKVAASSRVSERVTVPLYVLIGEAVDLARFAEHYWGAKRDVHGKIVQPGLELAARKDGLGKNTATELLELQEALQAAQTSYMLTVEPESQSPSDLGEVLLSELRATLEYFFDDHANSEDDARLTRLADEHEQPLSQDALAAALEDYAGLADLHRRQLDGFGGFEADVIDQARAVAKQIREASATRVAGPTATEQADALELRNQIAALLQQKMNAVRAAARFVFRKDHAIVRKATSTYQRRRRANARHRHPEPVPPAPVTPTPVTPTPVTPTA